MKIPICSETNEECEYTPIDDEPCHQCRIYRYMKKFENEQNDKIVS